MSKDLSGFQWTETICVKRFLGICTKKAIKLFKLEVEFKDKIQAKTFLDAGFVLEVRRKPIQ